MIITGIEDWRPRAGTLWECRPTARSKDVAAQAESHPGPVTFLQEGHLRAAFAKLSGGGVHTAYTGVATEIDGDLDIHALARVAETFTRRHDALRCWFDIDEGAVTRHMVSENDVEFSTDSPGRFDTDAEFQEYVTHRFSEEASPQGWPGFALGAVAREGTFTLYYGADHAFTDGGSQALAVSELADLYLIETGQDAPALAPAGSHLAYAAVEQSRTDTFGPDSPEMRTWKAIFADHGNKMPTFPLDLGLDPGESAPVVIMGRQLLDAEETARFDHVCKSNGTRLSSGIFAAVAIADHELAGADDYFGITVLSTRHLGDYAHAQGWFVNFAPVAFPVAGSESFTQLLTSAHHGFEQAKRLAAVPIAAVLTALASTGVPLDELTASPNLLSYIDFRWFPGVGRPADERGVHFTGEGSTANASMWINRDFDHLYLIAQVPNTSAAVAAVDSYHSHIESVIRSVACEGDYALTQKSAPRNNTEDGIVDASHSY